MTFFWLPLEKLSKRYTVLTRKWFSNAFKEHKLKYSIIEGESLTSDIKNSNFLDCYSTIHYKSTQISKLSKIFMDNLVKNDDIFFVDDIWMPGIESIKYMANMNNIKVYVCGIYHAGSHTNTDDVATKIGRYNWVADYEKSILKMCDKVFVGSEFHKSEIERYHKQKFDNIIVTGLAFNPIYIKNLATPLSWNKRENIVLFPHRIHKEKLPKLFDIIEKTVKKVYPDIKFIKTMEKNLSKKSLYKLMAKSKVMFSAALQENFGYATLECATLGCDLLLPRRLSYREFYSEDCFYNKESEILEMLIKKINSKNRPPQQTIVNYMSKSVDRIINEIKKFK